MSNVLQQALDSLKNTATKDTPAVSSAIKNFAKTYAGVTYNMPVAPNTTFGQIIDPSRTDTPILGPIRQAMSVFGTPKYADATVPLNERVADAAQRYAQNFMGGHGDFALADKALLRFGEVNPEEVGNFKAYIHPNGKFIQSGGYNGLGDHGADAAELMSLPTKNFNDLANATEKFSKESGAVRVGRYADESYLHTIQPLNKIQIDSFRKTLLPDGGTIEFEGPHKQWTSIPYKDESDGMIKLNDFLSKNGLIHDANDFADVSTDDLMSAELPKKGYSPTEHIENFSKYQLNDANYQRNLEHLQKAGISLNPDGTVTLYRGSPGKERDMYKAFSYWTTSPKVAKTFGRVKEIRIDPHELISNGESMAVGGAESAITFQNPVNLVKQADGTYSMRPKSPVSQPPASDVLKKAVEQVKKK